MTHLERKFLSAELRIQKSPGGTYFLTEVSDQAHIIQTESPEDGLSDDASRSPWRPKVVTLRVKKNNYGKKKQTLLSSGPSLFFFAFLEKTKKKRYEPQMPQKFHFTTLKPPLLTLQHFLPLKREEKRSERVMKSPSLWTGGVFLPFFFFFFFWISLLLLFWFLPVLPVFPPFSQLAMPPSLLSFKVNTSQAIDRHEETVSSVFICICIFIINFSFLCTFFLSLPSLLFLLLLDMGSSDGSLNIDISVQFCLRDCLFVRFSFFFFFFSFFLLFFHSKIHK